MDKTLVSLIKISNKTGKDVSLVQGGGGNTSAKTPDGKYMYIKASGTALKDMSADKGWRKIRLGLVRSIINDETIVRLQDQTREVEVVNRLLLACEDNFDSSVRPSVEAHLHAFLDDYVIHLHPNAVGAFVNAKNGKARLEKLFKDQKPPILWVSYADPGFMLARKVAKLTSQYKQQYGTNPRILFLEKHGLFVTAPTPEKALGSVRMVIKRCESKLVYPRTVRKKVPDSAGINHVKLAIRKAFYDATGRYSMVHFFADERILAHMRQSDIKKILSAPPLTPDELVYANGPAVWIDNLDTERHTQRLAAHIIKAQKPPMTFLVRNLGLFVAAEKRLASTIRDIVVTSLFVRTNATRFGGIAALNKRQRHFINEWEAEAFRRKLAAGDSKGNLQGQIVVVTGGGSGLGRSISLGLARAGANIAIADIDKKAAQKTAEFIHKENPNAQTLLLECDVTKEESVHRAFESLLHEWGGLDIVVNAAGIAPMFALNQMPVDKWRLTLEVNLTGYFLMAKTAAEILIKQKMGGNIINISSKSGLEASKNNTAYNATKAGEIHMARGWAMELGPYGIRVNSVAPGNVFEGSRIWNPQYIKAAARKYGIKPEQVIPFYVRKTSLNREIKGSDVADSVVFLCSDKARTITGQTLVPDSGQVMVR